MHQVVFCQTDGLLFAIATAHPAHKRCSQIVPSGLFHKKHTNIEMFLSSNCWCNKAFRCHVYQENIKKINVNKADLFHNDFEIRGTF